MFVAFQFMVSLIPKHCRLYFIVFYSMVSYYHSYETIENTVAYSLVFVRIIDTKPLKSQSLIAFYSSVSFIRNHCLVFVSIADTKTVWRYAVLVWRYAGAADTSPQTEQLIADQLFGCCQANSRYL